MRWNYAVVHGVQTAVVRRQQQSNTQQGWPAHFHSSQGCGDVLQNASEPCPIGGISKLRLLMPEPFSALYRKAGKGFAVDKYGIEQFKLQTGATLEDAMEHFKGLKLGKLERLVNLKTYEQKVLA